MEMSSRLRRSLSLLADAERLLAAFASSSSSSSSLSSLSFSSLSSIIAFFFLGPRQGVREAFLGPDQLQLAFADLPRCFGITPFERLMARALHFLYFGRHPR